jgi:hypothetical protein
MNQQDSRSCNRVYEMNVSQAVATCHSVRALLDTPIDLATLRRQITNMKTIKKLARHWM